MRTISIQIQWNGAELQGLRKPVVGEGGWQSLLRMVQSKTDTTGKMSLEPPEIEKLIRYSKYGEGGGGFQQRLAALAKGLASLHDIGQKGLDDFGT